MSRIARVLACCALGAAALAPSAHADGARLSPSGGAFPVRSFVLTLPTNAAVATTDVQVAEDGQPVQRLSVVPATSRFAVLLLIDASTSMRGEPIGGAMAAARAFAAQRPAAQPLGIVTFNATPRVLAQPTTDPDTLTRALDSRPTLIRGTHIYDAIAAALKEVDPAKFDAAAIVVLSDGHEYGSDATPAQIASSSQGAHARLFTVGLRSSLFDPKSLESIASLGKGEFLGAASPKALAAIYRRLGDQLANAYTIRYLSSAPAGAGVKVQVTAGAERATSDYIAPTIRARGELGSSLEAPGTEKASFFSTTAGALVIAALVVLLIVGGIGIPVQHQMRRAAMRGRVSEYGGRPATTADLEPGARRHRSERIERLQERLELARIDVSAARFLIYTVLGTVVLALIVSAIFQTGFMVLVAIVAGPLLARAFLRRQIARQRRLFADQLADSIQAVTSAMRTGNSFIGALSQLVDHAPEPTASEFRRVIADERLGVPLDTALQRMVARMDNNDLKQVGLVTVIQRETGGNGAEALDRVVGNIRARDDIRRLVRTLTAQGRMSQLVLTALPVITAVALKVLGGEAMAPLYETGYGHALLAFAAVLIAIGGLWIGRIVKVKV